MLSSAFWPCDCVDIPYSWFCVVDCVAYDEQVWSLHDGSPLVHELHDAFPLVRKIRSELADGDQLSRRLPSSVNMASCRRYICL